MKLYYSPGACSTSCHILLEEAGLKYEAIEIDWDDAAQVEKVEKMNPLGQLPVLVLDNGTQLDQNLAIQVYAADQAPQKNLLPREGTLERAQALNWLSFVCSDLHSGVGALFGLSRISKEKSVQEPVRKYMVDKANRVLKYLDDNLTGKDYLMGKQFTAADAYAFVVTGWTQWLEIPLAPYKNILAYRKRIEARPAVAKVLKDEGISS